MPRSGNMMRALLISLAAALNAAALFGGGLAKYKGWDKSPLGDLMTARERARWATIRTDDEADAFIKDFLSERSPELVAKVQHAAAEADRYLTVGKTAGSVTERGRLVIMLGPPETFSVSETRVRAETRGLSQGPASATGGILKGSPEELDGRPGAGDEVADLASLPASPGNGSEGMSVFTFTYPAGKLPPAYGKALTVRIQVDPSGADRIAGRATKAELNRLYEMIAEAGLSASAAPAATQH